MNITLECHYCGNEDTKMTWERFGELASDPTAEIKCKCGKWLLKDGNLGHKHTERVVTEDQAYGNDCPRGGCE